MQTRNITLKEYCRLSGYSYHSKGVNRHLQAGNLTVGMVEAKKFGNSWMITVLESWYNSRLKDLTGFATKEMSNKELYDSIIKEAEKRYSPILPGDKFDPSLTISGEEEHVHPNIREWSLLRGKLYSMPYKQGGYVVYDGFNWADKIPKK